MSSPSIPAPQITHKEETASQEETERPHRVLIHNDDVTPYDFVIVILVRIFELDSFAAEAITWTAHTNGFAQVVVLPLSEANRKVGRAHFAAALEGYPLKFSVEPA